MAAIGHSLGYPGNIGGANTLQLCASESYSPSSSCGGSGEPWIRHYRTGTTAPHAPAPSA